MNDNWFKFKSVRVLTIGFVILIGMFTTVTVTDRHIQNDQDILIQESDRIVDKIKIIVDMIEIARTRIRLVYNMLEADDVFDRDLINQEIRAYSGKFSKKYTVLTTDYGLSEEDLDDLKDLNLEIKIVVTTIEKVAELSVLDDGDSLKESKRLLSKIIVPKQQLVVSKYISLLNNSRISLKRMNDEYDNHIEYNKKLRNYLTLSVVYYQ